MPNHKNITVVITIENFVIKTDINEKEAILEALAEELDECSGNFKEYFTDPTITITATDS